VTQSVSAKKSPGPGFLGKTPLNGLLAPGDSPGCKIRDFRKPCETSHSRRARPALPGTRCQEPVQASAEQALAAEKAGSFGKSLGTLAEGPRSRVFHGDFLIA
jgi:hypothetical protein